MTHLPPKAHNTFTRRLAYLQSRAWLPPAILLLALSSLFLFDGARGYFRGTGGIHDQISAKNMAIAENLSIDLHFLTFTHQTLDADGKPAYEPYSRFPIGSYALIKLAILPFGDGLSDKIYAARMLMLLFFAAAAALAYLSLLRLTSNRWIALTAALLAFSSPYCLYYGDAISSEMMVDIFGALLVFHGMVIFEQEGRFRQLLLKTCIALLLGWHVYGMLLPFIVFGMMRELVRARSDCSTLPKLCQLTRMALSLMRNRYLTLGVVTLLFGISMLTFNFTNEYFALNRETRLTELPSFKSMMDRTGFSSNISSIREDVLIYLHWSGYLERQFHRIGAMSIPYAFSPSFVDHDLREAQLRSFVILGIAASIASLIGLLFVRRHRILLVTPALSGFCWALPMRYSTAYPHHQFEALYYMGITLTLFSLILLCLRSLSGERLVAALSVVSALIFALSALRMSQLTNPDQTTELHKAALADFEVIRNMTDGKAILVNAMPKIPKMISALYHYYFSGRAIIIDRYQNVPSARQPDFVVTGTRIGRLASLTPQNQMIFLYEWDDYHRRIDEIIESGKPLIRASFDVYLTKNALMYVKDPCRRNDAKPIFFLALFPADESALPSESRQHGFHNLDFRFQDGAIWRGDQCISIVPLPDYDIARIYTGQYIQRADGATQHLWEGEFRPAYRLINDRMRRINETLEQAGAPLIRSDFDVYLNDNMLIYVKNDCRMSDTTTDFFLAVFPVNEIDLLEGSRQHGFHNLDFRFHENGIRQSNDRCLAVVHIPNYDIARIYTGQYIQLADGSTEHTWEGEFRFTEEMR